MDSKKKFLFIGVALVVTLVVVFVIYQGKQKALRNTTLITAFNELPETLNPLFEQNSSGSILIDTIFDGLTNRSGEKINDYRFGLASDIIQDEDDPKV